MVKQGVEMADSQADAKVFSTRIVTMDYYMTPPIPDFDICYSSFQGGKVSEVPVIRIYGPTPAGQKTCLHIHKALPYLYIPCGDLLCHQDQEGSALAQSVCLAIEKALKLKGNAGSKRQHVHSCTVVRAKKFYGYHSCEELFMKVQLYHPQDISRVSSLLLAGAVLDKILQPYESHIPFILQFLIDYNLYGMGHIHFSKIKFRHPVPEVHHINKVFYDGARGNAAACSIGNSADSKAGLEVKDDLLSSLPIWTFGTLPADWVWPSWNQSDVPSAQDHSLVERQSHSELEGDAVVEDILNQLLIPYTPLSQSISGVRMVQSLVPIWEEELQRSGIQCLDVPPNTAKPLPEDVLKILSNWSNVEDLLKEKLGVSSSNSSSEKHVKSPSKTQRSLLLQASADGLQISNPVGPSNAQTFDQDALGLLKWLASSQAVEEINSDDELARETILSPLLPATEMAKLLEKASMDFECLSQQECQDILDSVVVEGPSEGVCTSDDNRVSHDSLSNKMIPQVDGSADDFNLPTHDCKPSFKITSESGISADHDLPCCSSSPTSCCKRKTKRWGSLPVSLGQNSNIFSATNSGNGIGSFQNNAEAIKTSFPRIGSLDHVRKAASSPSDCSMRELMRKKRCYRTELPDCRLSDISHILPEKEQVLSSDAVSAGSHTPGLFFGETSNMVVSKSPHGTEISVEKSPETSNGIPMCADVLKGSSCIPDTMETSLCLNSKPNSSGLIAMTLCQKPPVVESINGLGSSVTSPPFETHDHSLLKERDEGMLLHPGRLDDLPPFFTRNHLKGNELTSVCCSEDYYVCGNNKGVVMGVPIHYLNDGSHLYMLSPVISPPSGESVKRWLLDRGTSVRKSMESEAVLSTSPQNLSDDPVDAQGCLAEDLDLTLPGSSLESGESFHLNVSSKHDQGTCTEDVESHHNEVAVVHHKEGSCSKSKQYCSQDMSQLSGPDSKSKLTPLSQIGFRDPASVSGTQQLTILSIEVVAESRGDLRPDPRFDAVNIIALVIQADDDPKNEAFILLRSGKEASKENLDGICECKVLIFQEEKLLFSHFVMVVSFFDPDMLMGWDVQGSSLGFLAERAAFLGIGLLNELSRTPSVGNAGSSNLNASGKEMQADLLGRTADTNNLSLEDAIIDDEWGRTHASGVHVGGRIVLNIWRLMRNEVKLNMYTVEAVAEAVLRRKIPFIPYRVLTRWFSSGPGCARYRCVEYVVERAELNLRIMNQLDMINRTSELARVFGIDFFSVLSRGSQYRVESMFLRLAHTQNYLAISPGSQQVAYQPAMECLPLVMEPESGFYADPVVVLDFQSLYPSMIIAYNLCFSTCLGKIVPSKENTLGVSSYSPDRDALESLKEEMLVTPNGVMYVPSKFRIGILPRLLEEILSTRIMIKQAMKRLDPSQQVLHRIFNARQLALKLIANVTYGYTAAGFSGRMPCAELADSIVQCARRTLEQSILFVNNHETWKAKVVYGDTDSMFVLLKGRSRREAFKIGGEIAAAVTAMNPDPVVLKMEKVYHPCFLLTKKRYAGYSYESDEQIKPKFDAKGIETVRRDTCAAVSKTLEQTLRIYFEHEDIGKVKDYLLRQWKRIMSGRISLQDFIFAKEVRLGTYSARASSLPPGAIIATKAMKADPRAEPRYAERIPYVVVHGEPGARLVDMVVDPLELLAIDSPFRLNDVYYIRKQIIPALQRVFGLVGADLNKWYSELPRPEREALGKRILHGSSTHRTRIDFYYLSRHCILCGALVHASSYLCRNCSVCEATLATILTGRTAKLEKNIQHLVAICRHCGGGDWVLESGVKCTSLACSIFYERRKVQKELHSISAVASEAGFYPTCMAELF